MVGAIPGRQDGLAWHTRGISREENMRSSHGGEKQGAGNRMGVTIMCRYPYQDTLPLLLLSEACALPSTFPRMSLIRATVNNCVSLSGCEVSSYMYIYGISQIWHSAVWGAWRRYCFHFSHFSVHSPLSEPPWHQPPPSQWTLKGLPASAEAPSTGPFPLTAPVQAPLIVSSSPVGPAPPHFPTSSLAFVWPLPSHRHFLLPRLASPLCSRMP